MRQGDGSYIVQDLFHLTALNSRELLEEVVDCAAVFEAIEECSDRHARAVEYRRSAQHIWVAADDGLHASIIADAGHAGRGRPEQRSSGLDCGLAAWHGGGMKTYIALLRGINVGGKGTLPMKELVAMIESLGCRNVRTYIQSGNAVFQHTATDSAKLASKLTKAIEKARGFAPQVVMLEAMDLAKLVKANPFPEAEAEPKSLHVWFLAAKPAKANIEALTRLKANTERFELRGSAFYLHAPDGIGRSKLAAKIERHLGASSTARNWRTVSALLEIANERG